MGPRHASAYAFRKLWSQPHIFAKMRRTRQELVNPPTAVRPGSFDVAFPEYAQTAVRKRRHSTLQGNTDDIDELHHHHPPTSSITALRPSTRLPLAHTSHNASAQAALDGRDPFRRTQSAARSSTANSSSSQHARVVVGHQQQQAVNGSGVATKVQPKASAANSLGRHGSRTYCSPRVKRTGGTRSQPSDDDVPDHDHGSGDEDHAINGTTHADTTQPTASDHTHHMSQLELSPLVSSRHHNATTMPRHGSKDLNRDSPSSSARNECQAKTTAADDRVISAPALNKAPSSPVRAAPLLRVQSTPESALKLRSQEHKAAAPRSKRVEESGNVQGKGPESLPLLDEDDSLVQALHASDVTLGSPMRTNNQTAGTKPTPPGQQSTPNLRAAPILASSIASSPVLFQNQAAAAHESPAAGRTDVDANHHEPGLSDSRAKDDVPIPDSPRPLFASPPPRRREAHIAVSVNNSSESDLNASIDLFQPPPASEAPTDDATMQADIPMARIGIKSAAILDGSLFQSTESSLDMRYLTSAAQPSYDFAQTQLTVPHASMAPSIDASMIPATVPTQLNGTSEIRPKIRRITAHIPADEGVTQAELDEVKTSQALQQALDGRDIRTLFSLEYDHRHVCQRV